MISYIRGSTSVITVHFVMAVTDIAYLGVIILLTKHVSCLLHTQHARQGAAVAAEAHPTNLHDLLEHLFPSGVPSSIRSIVGNNGVGHQTLVGKSTGQNHLLGGVAGHSNVRTETIGHPHVQTSLTGNAQLLRELRRNSQLIKELKGNTRLPGKLTGHAQLRKKSTGQTHRPTSVSAGHMTNTGPKFPTIGTLNIKDFIAKNKGLQPGSNKRISRTRSREEQLRNIIKQRRNQSLRKRSELLKKYQLLKKQQMLAKRKNLLRNLSKQRQQRKDLLRRYQKAKQSLTRRRPTIGRRSRRVARLPPNPIPQ